MTDDDLSAPLGRQPSRPRRKFPVSAPYVIAVPLAIFLGIFALWAIVGDNPFGGEPMAAAPIALRPVAVAKKSDAVSHQTSNDQTALNGPAAGNSQTNADEQNRTPDGAGSSAPTERPGTANTKTITIINGKTGARENVVIPSAGGVVGSADHKFVELTPRGAIPKIAADGTRPADAFARPVSPLAGKPDAPRIALIVGGLGISATATADAIARLPGAVTLAFVPYGSDVQDLVARARSAGHEILLQVPMEPVDYPNNDPGPQALLTTLTREQNFERLHWLMSRFQGYVGITDTMGARFMAAEPSLAPVLRETARRGLIFVDDGANPRSVAARIAGADNLPFAKADLSVDSVPTPGEIDRALGRLEMAAREHGSAIGVSSALPVSIEHIAKWAKAAESRGLLLVPITALASKVKQS